MVLAQKHINLVRIWPTSLAVQSTALHCPFQNSMVLRVEKIKSNQQKHVTELHVLAPKLSPNSKVPGTNIQANQEGSHLWTDDCKNLSTQESSKRNSATQNGPRVCFHFRAKSSTRIMKFRAWQVAKSRFRSQVSLVLIPIPPHTNFVNWSKVC